MPVLWDGDGSPREQFRIEGNLARLLTELQQTAAYRPVPTVEMAREWHRRTFDGVSVPVPYYVGGIRDSDPAEPELVDHEVGVQGPVAYVSCVPAANVPAELATFEAQLQQDVALLDAMFPPANAPPLSLVDDILRCAAVAHGEWVRIHPFVNGNGRIARIWANWCLLRYGLPAVLRLRPRPSGNTYASAAERSMHGDHRYMEIELVRLLTQKFANP